MTTVQERPETAGPKTTISDEEERRAALERAVADLTANGRRVESRPDYRAVLVGHNRFRVAMVRRRWGRECRELVEVDKQGNVSVRKV